MVYAHRRPTHSEAVGILVAVVLVLVVVPTTAGARSATVPAGSEGATTDLSSELSAPFATRAGFSSEYAAITHGVAPAQGSQLVVVTFEPRDPSFYSTPALGSAALTTSQVADRYGLSPSEYLAVEGYFQSEGLSVVHVWPDRLSLSLEGPVAALDRAFATTIEAGTSGGSRVTFPLTPPELPTGIESLVGSVIGLSSGFDTFIAAPLAGRSAVLASPSQGSGDLVTPDIARAIYGLSSLYNVSGSSQFSSAESIALLLWGYGYDPSDLTKFFQQDYPSSFPQPTINYYNMDGAPKPGPGAVQDPCNASIELTLDMEWSGSMAPGATLDAVYAPEGPSSSCSPSAASMTDALVQAINLPVAAISMSFGTPESSDSALRVAWDTYLAEADQKKITLLAATGDLGGDAQANCQGGPMTDYPSTSPDVLAVGGTDVSFQRNLLGTITGFTESGWSGSGGGLSTQYGAPSWQNGGSGPRQVPDVSATAAAPNNFFYFAGQDQSAGGTSFATPLWAGLITEMDALHGSPFGLVSPRLYAVGSAEETPGVRVATGLADITSGSNCVASAGPGLDEVTGWGSPRALPLYEDLTATFVNLSISVAPGTVAQGGSLTISGHLENATTSASIPNVPVVVTLSSSTDIGPCTGQFSSSTVPTDANGNLSVSMSVPACYLGSHAVAQVEVISDGYYGTNSTTVSVNLLGLVPALGVLAEYPVNVAAFVVIMAAVSTLGYFLGRRAGPPRPSGNGGSPVPTTTAPAAPVGRPRPDSPPASAATAPEGPQKA